MTNDIITLTGMEFFAYHGFYEEERQLGNRYSVDLEIVTNFESAAQEDNLDETVNYVVLYQVVDQVMKKSSKLLEHVAHEILKAIFEKYMSVRKAKVSVKKHNPPLGGICAFSSVVMERSREDFI